MSTRIKLQEGNLDKISDLPLPILDEILCRLPIKDAAKTSILSRQWRNKWINLSKLQFDDSSCGARSKSNVKSLVSVVYHVLLSHRGPIHTFKLSTSHNPSILTILDLYHWITFLSMNRVKELTIDIGFSPDRGNYELPLRFFDGQQLTHLHLRSAIFSRINDFQGFRSLVSLHLSNYHNYTDEGLANLIRKCPVLERLELRNFKNSAAFFMIEAPKLKYLYVDGRLHPILLRNCPVLEEITLSNGSDRSQWPNMTTDYPLVPYLSSLSSLKSLKFSGSFLKDLHKWGVSETPLALSNNNLKVVELNEINLDDLDEIKITYEIFKHFSNLQVLHISVKRSKLSKKTTEFLEAQSGSYLYFRLLKTVNIDIISSSPTDRWDHELKLIGFLLVHSPVLEKMTIVNHSFSVETNTAFMKKLLLCKLASSEVQIAYCPAP